MIFSLVFPFGKTFREAPRPQNLLIGAHFLLFTVLSLFISIFTKVWQKITKERKWYLTSVCIHTHTCGAYIFLHIPVTRITRATNEAVSSYKLSIKFRMSTEWRSTLILFRSADLSACPHQLISRQHIPLVNLTQGILFKLLLSQSHGSVLFVTFEFPFCLSSALDTLHFSFFVVFREILIQCLINKIIDKSLLNDLQLGSNIFAWDKLGIRKNSMMSGPAAPLVFSTCSPREWLLSLPGITPLNMCECKQAKLL